MAAPIRHLGCPYCDSYDVERLFIATTRADACRCGACGASWDEEPGSGRFLGRAGRASVLTGRPRS